MSYLAWSTMPDDELFTDAASGALLNADFVAQRTVPRLLADRRATDGALQFVNEWLGVHVEITRKGVDVTQGLEVATLQRDLEQEHEAFVREALLAPGGSLDTLLAAKFGYVSPNGARVMNLPPVNELTRFDFSDAPRRGLLTSPLLIAAHAKESGYSVVQLGRFVRERLLCQPIPPPPSGVDTSLPSDPSSAGLSYREKLAHKTAVQPCASCHQYLNPPGFAYLDYDPIGRVLALDSRGVPFDTSGTLLGLNPERPFSDAPSMIDAIATSDEVRECFARRQLEHAMGRTYAPADAQLFRALVKALRDDRGNYQRFVTTLLSSVEITRAGPTDP